MGVLIAGSCHKGPPPNPGGSWIFKNVTYPTSSCIAYDSIATLEAVDSMAGIVKGSITVNFYNVIPVGNGTYTVVGTVYPTAPYQVSINATIGDSNALSYLSTGGEGAETVTVSLSNGKIILTGRGIEMANTNQPSDSGQLSLNITQLQ